MSLDLGKVLLQKKYFAKATFIFQKVLKDKPNDLRANFLIGKVYYELNDLNRSITYFKKCYEIDPKNPNILYNLALTLQSTGKISEAKQIYLELISINSKDIKSYYGLNSLGIENITPEFYKNLKKIYKEKKISLFEKSLINFIFSKIEKKKRKLRK